MKTNPHSGGGVPANIETVKNLFRQKSLLERLTPVMGELLRTIRDGESSASHEKLLPEYCYNIFKILRKTYFKILPASECLVAGIPSKVDWQAWGKMIGAGLRCARFGEMEMDAILARESVSGGELIELIGTIPGISSELPTSAILESESGVEGTFANASKWLHKALAAGNQAAYRVGPIALAQLNGAAKKGVGGFLDEKGECVGESGRANIYWFLLFVWPEIQEMQQRNPPVTRADFDRWIQPFAHCGLVSIRDLDQLLDVCDGIGLKFRGRGQPRKKYYRTAKISIR